MNVPKNTILLSDSHKGVVSALAIDRSGSRMISGGYDSVIKYWDFHSMTRSLLNPFRSHEPCGSYPIKDIHFAHNSDRLLFISNSTQPRIHDRHGYPIMEFTKGDSYLVDMRKTKGHVQAMNCGSWHYNNSDIFLTAAMDSTIRIWNVNQKDQNDVIVARNTKQQGHRLAIQTAVFCPSNNGRIIAGSDDGFIRIWSDKSPFHKPLVELESYEQCIITSISIKDQLLAARYNNSSLGIWDMRKLKEKLLDIRNEELFTDYIETNCVFSPDGQYICTASSILHNKKQKNTENNSGLFFFSVNTGELIHRTIESSSMIRVLWHESLNQIFVGQNDGLICAYYNSTIMNPKGIALCLSKETLFNRDFTVFDDSIGPEIYTPNALLTDSKKSLKRVLVKDKEQYRPIVSQPEPQLSGPGKGGRIGSNITQHMMKNIMKDTGRDEDPREALLKYAKIAEEKPVFVTPAYSKTQPKPIFQEEKE